MKRLFAICLLLVSGIASAQPLVRWEIGPIRDALPDGRAMHLAGSFNRWNPADSNTRFLPAGDGRYALSLRLPPGTYEYKLTLGNWDLVETDMRGKDRPNRILVLEQDTVITLQVDGWRDGLVHHSAGPGVRVIDTTFPMKALGRTRRVWVRLPPGYDNTGKRYPVLYMHDGQNLFDDATAFSGEWGVDEYLDTSLAPPCIVVGVDNGGVYRIPEYAPFGFPLRSQDADTINPEGAAYLQFLVTELKPFIDAGFRTRSGRKHTYIAGSSLGGLISFFALLQYPEVFGGAGIFSPSFWVGRERLENSVKTKGRKVRSRTYFYAGTAEGKDMVSDLEAMVAVWRKVAGGPVRVTLAAGARHHEAAWRQAFPAFYEWLMKRR